jgi:hypothetical protein
MQEMRRRRGSLCPWRCQRCNGYVLQQILATVGRVEGTDPQSACAWKPSGAAMMQVDFVGFADEAQPVGEDGYRSAGTEAREQTC